jgi:hypothetical protein
VLEPNSSAAVLVWEDVWAAKLAKRSAMREASCSTWSAFHMKSSGCPEGGLTRSNAETVANTRRYER